MPSWICVMSMNVTELQRQWKEAHLRHAYAQVDNGMRPVNHEHGPVRNDPALIHGQRHY
jgi:hypothetical protein